MKSQRPYIIIEGAQSTGKSTLVNQIKASFPHVTIVSEVARSVIHNQKITHEQLQNNINNCFQDLQYKILLAQTSQENNQQARQCSDSCILDRCVVSPLVYSLFYFKEKEQVAKKIEGSPQFQTQIRKYRNSNYMIFLLHPEESIIKCDGVRRESTYQDLCKLTTIYHQVLEKYQIPYHTIKQLHNRLQIVRTVVKEFKKQYRIDDRV